MVRESNEGGCIVRSFALPLPKPNEEPRELAAFRLRASIVSLPFGVRVAFALYFYIPREEWYAFYMSIINSKY